MEEDLLAIPAFLKRKPLTKAQQRVYYAKQAKDKDVHRGSKLSMPQYRHNPRNAIRAAQQRVIPSRSKEANRDMPKGDKPLYPTTEALKVAIAGLDNGEKRKLNYAIAKENGINPTKWDHLNNGQVAMNLGNVLRGRYYKNETIIIQGKEVQ